MTAYINISEKINELRTECANISNPANGGVAMKKVTEIFDLDAPLDGLPEYLPVRLEKNKYVPEVEFFYFEPSLLRRVLLSYLDKDAIMLTGLKGTGKSSFVRQFCARMGIPVMIINCGPGVGEDFLLGGKDFDGKKVRSLDGLVSYAARHGIQVCLDEISALRPSVVVALNDILEKGDVITLKHHGLDPSVKPSEDTISDDGNIIVRHPFFRIWATDNGGGKAVRRAANTGINTLNEATRSRFTYFNVNYMKPSQEFIALKKVLGQHHAGLNTKDIVLKGMIMVANRVRKALHDADGHTMDTISFRELKRWAWKTQTYGCFHEAFCDAVYSGLEEPSKVFVSECFEHEFCTELQLPIDAYAHYEVDASNVNWNEAA